VQEAAERELLERLDVEAELAPQHDGDDGDVQAVLVGIRVVRVDRPEAREDRAREQLGDDAVDELLHSFSPILKELGEASAVECGPDLVERARAQRLGVLHGERQGVLEARGRREAGRLGQHVFGADLARLVGVDPQRAEAQGREALEVSRRQAGCRD
jgi:hypothetical protein